MSAFQQWLEIRRRSYGNDKKGIPWEVFQAARKPISEAHNRQETSGFAKTRLKGQVILLVDTRIQQI